MTEDSSSGTEMAEDRSLTGFKDKRRSRRVAVNLPVKVRGTNIQGVQFEEMTHSIDVSSGGALILLKQPLSKGMDLELSLPMPPGCGKPGLPAPPITPLLRSLGFTPLRPLVTLESR